MGERLKKTLLEIVGKRILYVVPESLATLQEKRKCT